VGVTIPKKIILITIGEAKLPKSIPSLNQILFKGDKIIEFNKPKIKKIKEIISDQTLRSPLLNTGYIETIRNTIKKTIPKLLFEDTFIFLFIIFNDYIINVFKI
tara:strand:- start:451 stop:762 length:312 start_codon:yes stop_codon:yes gene_type:complete